MAVFLETGGGFELETYEYNDDHHGQVNAKVRQDQVTEKDLPDDQVTEKDLQDQVKGLGIGRRLLQRQDSTSSACSLDEFELRPLSLTEVVANKKPAHTEENHHQNGLPPSGKYFSRAMGLGQKRKRADSESSLKDRLLWKHALMKMRTMSDPWEKFHVADLQSEKALRHRYNALEKAWVTDTCTIKMEKEPFNHGAMRECFRMKKLSTFSNCEVWNKESNNYVAKRYMGKVERDIYFEDVKLQMDAKLWGEEYNRHNPPKKVDIFQMAVLELVDREDKPLYHVEHFIDGDYMKYNSNSGFVDIGRRRTPQAFSHFTFERSGHQLIVVDIQGVGDLYTDPQIHTAAGKEYGDGNLGTRGMALFFHSHICNAICEGLGLTKFDLHDKEKSEWPYLRREASKVKKTMTRGTEELCLSPSDYDATHLVEFFRRRTGSGSFGSFSSLVSDDEGIDDWFLQRWRAEIKDVHDDDLHSPASRQHSNLSSSSNDSGLGVRRRRYTSESSATLIGEKEKKMFGEEMDRVAKPSNVFAEVQARKVKKELNQKPGVSILGQIHLDMARYHEILRFSPQDSEEYDKEAALFHLRHAADCGDLDACRAMSHIYLNLPHDILADIELPETEENINLGVNYMRQAAEAGCRSGMIFMAKAYDSGIGLGTVSEKCWKDAVRWYDEALEQAEGDEDGGYDSTMHDPPYSLLARQAEMYREGGHGLEKDPNKAGELYNSAAESAMECMKGRLANKYFMLAEEAWGEVEEEE